MNTSNLKPMHDLIRQLREIGSGHDHLHIGDVANRAAAKLERLQDYVDKCMTENPATWATHGRHLKEIMES